MKSSRFFCVCLQLILMTCASDAAVAQGVATPAAFDAASVKPDTASENRSSISRSGGRIDIEGTSLKEIVFFAYGIPWGRDYELSAPDWLDSERFDIIATFPPDSSRERVREMLRSLLAERFGMKAHNESRKFEAYVLLVGRRGPRLQPNANADDGAFIFGEDHLTGRAVSMAGLADRLCGPPFKLDRPVVDMTGIKGAFDFTLNWTPDGVLADGRSSPSLFTALQEQLGLRLETRKIALRILVVDHMEKVPTGN